MQRARDRTNSELTAALEKAKAATPAENAGQSADAVKSTEELTKRHAKELEDLRAQLTAQHELALKKAVDAATVTAKAEAPPASADATRIAIEAAIAAHELESKANLEKEIAAAVERGRMELGMKLKVKDAQAVRLQSKVKELESQIMEWQNQGVLPVAEAATSPATTASASNPPVPTSAAAPGSVSNPSVPTPAPAPATIPATSAATTSAPSTSTAPRPSGAMTAAASTIASLPKATRGGVPTSVAGRGVGRGSGTLRAPLRGAQGIRGRGGAPSPTAATAPPPGTFSIRGASKRTREEDPTPDNDSLAKRIKPAENADESGDASAAGSASKPPVLLRRPNPQQPSS